jgi:hypothetical protein
MSGVIRVTPSLQKAAEILNNARIGMGLSDFPFESHLSIRPLLNSWTRELDARDDKLQALARQIRQYSRDYPTILGSYQDVTALVKDHHSIIHLLFSGVFPYALSDTIYGYATPPFATEPFYMTSGLQDLLTAHDAKLKFEYFTSFDKVSYTIRACFVILAKYYNIHLDFALPFLFSLREEDTGMERFYKTTSLLDFLEVKVHKTPPDISIDNIDYLLQNLNDPEPWLQVFSPDVFYFEGFFLAMMSDVTEVETLSRLRKLLLTSDSFLELKTAKMVANLTRVYLNMATTEVGIFALDIPFEHSKAHRYKIHYPIIDDLELYLLSRVEENIYERACLENRIQIITNLAQIAKPSFIERRLLESGFKSLMVVPIRDHQKKVIGIMELASPEAYAFTHVKKIKLKEILPLYDVAVEESRNAVDHSIQNLIQREFTNIHPSVRWRFSETAFGYLDQKEKGGARQMDQIVFKELYPIFGQIDVNNSTKIRNRAVNHDLVKNLTLVGPVLEATYQSTNFHLLKKYTFEVASLFNRLAKGVDINLETSINDLLVKEIHPLLHEIKDQNLALSGLIDDYFQKLDPTLQVVFEARRDYEFGLKTINDTISFHLEEEEVINQKVLSHYFEKYQTDGIEYTIYVGQSILQRDLFSKHQLYNLRLWQLYSMVAIYGRLQEVRKDLPLDMTCTFLILVYNSPLDIKFLLEEKRFNVDGSYYARYEVLKRRIDKAQIAGTKERLAQRDKLVIVYLQQQDREEYLEYLQFLIDEDLLEPQIEDVMVEPLQEIEGVRALRAKFRRLN